MKRILEIAKVSVWYYAKSKSTKVSPAGVLVVMDWDGDDPERLYMSFSEDPAGKSYFDKFGMPDDDIYAYLCGLKDLIVILWSGKAIVEERIAAEIL
jgi:hypothetical protein